MGRHDAPALFVATFMLEDGFARDMSRSELFVGEGAGSARLDSSRQFRCFQSAAPSVLRVALLASFKTESRRVLALILLTVNGISFLLSGAFMMDPVTTPADRMSWHEKLQTHVFGALVFHQSPVACFVFLRRFRRDPMWRSLQRVEHEPSK
jgi:hypothetical protein